MCSCFLYFQWLGMAAFIDCGFFLDIILISGSLSFMLQLPTIPILEFFFVPRWFHMWHLFHHCGIFWVYSLGHQKDWKTLNDLENTKILPDIVFKCRSLVFSSFLAHLSTTCSWWAIVVSQCLSCVVRRAASTIALKAYSSYTPGPIDSILGRKHQGDL